MAGPAPPPREARGSELGRQRARSPSRRFWRRLARRWCRGSGIPSLAGRGSPRRTARRRSRRLSDFDRLVGVCMYVCVLINWCEVCNHSSCQDLRSSDTAGAGWATRTDGTRATVPRPSEGDMILRSTFLSLAYRRKSCSALPGTALHQSASKTTHTRRLSPSAGHPHSLRNLLYATKNDDFSKHPRMRSKLSTQHCCITTTLAAVYIYM